MTRDLTDLLNDLDARDLTPTIDYAAEPQVCTETSDGSHVWWLTRRRMTPADVLMATAADLREKANALTDLALAKWLEEDLL